VLVAAAGLVFEAITTVGGLLAGMIAFFAGRRSSSRIDRFSVLPAVEADGNSTLLK